jgi:hypothetical protein
LAPQLALTQATHMINTLIFTSSSLHYITVIAMGGYSLQCISVMDADMETVFVKLNFLQVRYFYFELANKAEFP